MMFGSTRIGISLSISAALLCKQHQATKYIKQFSEKLPKKTNGEAIHGPLPISQFSKDHQTAQIVVSTAQGLKALDYPKTSQTLWNNSIGRRPFFNMIEPKPCTKKIILEDFKKYLIKTNPIQFSRGCLFEVIRIIDHWNQRESIFDNKEIRKVLSGELRVEKATINDIFVRSTLKHHLMDQEDDQKNTAPTEKSFITKTVGHSALSSVYISAFEIQEHLDKFKQPLYAMVTWGRSDIETGYGAHAIIVFGIDRKDQVYFWDVSDKLDDKHSRIRTMGIEEFNDRRNIPPEPGTMIRNTYSRKDIYYFKSHKER